MKTKIEFNTKAYNPRRYSAPWIAKLDFSLDPVKPEFKWGNWIGDKRKGEEGILIIECESGDIIAKGQKDTYKPNNTVIEYYKVQEDGVFIQISKVEAYTLGANK